MSETGARDISLRIERMNCACLVPREHPDPERLRWRADAIARSRLVPALAQMIGSALDGTDQSVWRIRSLSVDLTLDPASVTDDDFSRAWSSRVVMSVGRALAQGDDGVNVLRFENRADLLARFALDLARGDAWGQWQYAEFEILRSLPDAMALAETLAREPEHTAGALLKLAELNGLERVLNALSPRGAGKVEAALLAQSPAQGNLTQAVFEAVLAVWAQSGVRSPYDNANNRLRLWTALRAQFTAPIADGDILLAGDALLSMADALREPDGNRRTATDRAREVYARAQESGDDLRAQAVLALINAGGDSDWLERAAQSVAPGAAQTPRPGTYTMLSPYIGAFTILPALVALGLDGIVSVLTASVDDEQQREALAQRLRMIVLIKCLGSASAADMVWDEAMRVAAGAQDAPQLRGVPRCSHEQIAAGYAALQLHSDEELRPMSTADMEALSLAGWEAAENSPGSRDWMETDAFTSAIAHAALTLFTRRLIGFERSSIPYIQRNFLLGLGSAAIDDREIAAQLPACPLAMILRMAGMDHTIVEVPWLQPARLRLVSDE